MARSLLALSLLFALSACSSGTSATVTTVPLSGLIPDAAVELSGARAALIEFLNGYAHASSDDGKSLEGLVAQGPPELRDWVHWLVVQNRSNPGQLTGTTQINSIRFQDFVAILGTIPGATMSLDASVTLTYTPPTGAPVTVTHDFTGDATVFERAPGDWGVYDVTRDGQSMDSAIHLLNKVSVQGHEVDMSMASIWTLTPFLSFNVTVANHGTHDLSFDAHRTALVGGPKTAATTSQSHTSGLDRIPAGGEASGTINFGTSSPATTALVVTFDGPKGAPVELSVSLKRLVNATTQVLPPTTTAPSPAPGG